MDIQTGESRLNGLIHKINDQLTQHQKSTFLFLIGTSPAELEFVVEARTPFSLGQLLKSHGWVSIGNVRKLIDKISTHDSMNFIKALLEEYQKEEEEEGKKF